MQPALITKVGDDHYGRDLIAMLEREGIGLAYETDGEHATGLVHVTEGDDHEMTYEIAFPAAWDFIQWQPSYEKLVSQAGCFVFGTLSNRYHVSREALHRLTSCSAMNVFDVNLRPPHFQQAGIEVLLRQTHMLKMNLSELVMITDWFGRGGHTEDRMKFLRHRFEIETIIVTRGAEGATILSDNRMAHHPGYKVKVQDTIGSGDSFLAGFLSRILRGTGAEEALDFASALGALIAGKAGGTPAYHQEEVNKIMGG